MVVTADKKNPVVGGLREGGGSIGKWDPRRLRTKSPSLLALVLREVIDEGRKYVAAEDWARKKAGRNTEAVIPPRVQAGLAEMQEKKRLVLDAFSVVMEGVLEKVETAKAGGPPICPEAVGTIEDFHRVFRRCPDLQTYFNQKEPILVQRYDAALVEVRSPNGRQMVAA